MAFVTTRSGGDNTIMVRPQNPKDQTALVVIAHGLGDTAEGFVDIAEVSLTILLLTQIMQCELQSARFAIYTICCTHFIRSLISTQ
jgi:hypothetical protein